MSSTIKPFLLAISLFSVALSLSGCREPSFGNQLSTKQETEIGRQAAEQVQSQFPVDADSADTRAVDSIAAKIIPVTKTVRGDIEYHVRVLKTDDLNSFGLPGGWIYIDAGLIHKIGADNDALACVIAHEAAHAALRHSARELTDAYGTDSMIDLLTEGKYDEAANISLQLSVLSHSNQDEVDADRLGLKLAKAAGYNPDGMTRFMAIIQALPEDDKTWASIHPVPKNRLKHLDQDIKDLRAGKY